LKDQHELREYGQELEPENLIDRIERLDTLTSVCQFDTNLIDRIERTSPRPSRASSTGYRSNLIDRIERKWFYRWLEVEPWNSDIESNR
jgi:hypothetical protein